VEDDSRRSAEWRALRRNQEVTLETLNHLVRLLPGDVGLALARADLLERLGRQDEAIQAYVSLLRHHPTEWASLERLGALLVETGRLTAAGLVFQEQLRRRPDDARAHAHLAHLLQQSGAFERARAEYLTALRLDPDLRPAHEGLAVLLSDLGEEEAAARHRATAFRDEALRVLPYRGTDPPVRVLVLASAHGGNLRYRSLLETGPFALTVLVVEFWDEKAALPAHDVVLNAIGDRDRAGPALDRARVLLGHTEAPVVNVPEAVRGRQDVLNRARRIEGILAPEVAAVDRRALAQSGVGAMMARLRAQGIDAPFLLRSLGFHSGRHLLRVERAEDLMSAAARLPGDTLLAIKFVDTKDARGLYHKYRVMAVGDRLFAGHLAFHHDWKVHYVTSLTPERDDLQALERDFLDHMEAALPRSAIRALEELAAVLRLEYVGFDFALASDGRVVLFEANPAMLLLQPPERARYRDARQRAAAAVAQRLQDLLRTAGTRYGGSNAVRDT